MASAAAAAQEAKPRMVLSEEKWEIGTLEQGQTATRTITVTNKGTAELRIRYIRSTCPTCTGSIAGARKIPPGESGKIVLTFRSKGLRGRQNRVVYIHGNDPDAPYKAVRITGTVVRSKRPVITIEPEMLDVGLVTKGSETARTVTISNEGDAPLKVARVVGSKACTAGAVPEEAVKPEGKAELEVRLDGAKLDGLIQEFVTVETNDPVTPTKTVAVVGYATSAASVVQNAVTIRPVGKPVKIPGKGQALYRAYRVENSLGSAVLIGGWTGPKRGRKVSLKPGQKHEIEVPVGGKKSPPGVRLLIWLPGSAPAK